MFYIHFADVLRQISVLSDGFCVVTYLRSSGDVVGEWTGVFDLRSSGKGDQDPEGTCNSHEKPKVGPPDLWRRQHLITLSKDEHERDEEERRDDVVVKSNLPWVVVYEWVLLLDVDCVQCDKEGSSDTADHTDS